MIVGIDASTRRIGLAFVCGTTGRAVRCGMYRANLSERGWRMQPVAGWMEDEYDAAFGDLGWLEDVTAVYVEFPAIPHRSGVMSAASAGRALQVAIDAARSVFLEAPVTELREAEWKQRAEVHKRKGTTLEDLEALVPPPWPSRTGAKPAVYRRALDLGFRPEGVQDAADAGCIAYAGYVTERGTAPVPTRRRLRTARSGG